MVMLYVWSLMVQVASMMPCLWRLVNFYAGAGDALFKVGFDVVTVDEASKGVRGFCGVHVGFPFLRGGVTW